MPSPAALSSILTGFNAEYIANLYNEFLKNPSGVDASWRAFFDTLRDDERAVLGELTGASWTAKEFKKPNAPFGGEKNSGLGRFNGHYAIDEFTRAHWITWRQSGANYPF